MQAPGTFLSVLVLPLTFESKPLLTFWVAESSSVTREPKKKVKEDLLIQMILLDPGHRRSISCLSETGDAS